MDVYCVICGDVWDQDEFEDVADARGLTWPEMLADFRARGCAALAPVYSSACRPAEGGLLVEAAYSLGGPGEMAEAAAEVAAALS